MTELEQLCENALYDEMRVLEDGKSVVRDIPTGKLYFKKTLDVYNEHVYAFLKEHRNKNVAGIQAYWKDGERLVVIEELIQGRTLDHLLQDGESTLPEAERNIPPLTFTARIDILSQICDGLQFLHSAQPPIIHRDIKASNIMVTDDSVVKIIDYDAAKIYIAGQDKDTMMIGTQGLAAPEQYGFAQSNVRTDLYALGKLIERILPDNVDAKRIAEKATEMDPRKRYTSAAQMKAQIQKIREKPALLDQKLEKIHGYDPMNKSHRIRARIALAAAILAAVLLASAIGWRLFVYPVRQEEAIRTELTAIDESQANGEEILDALEKLGAEYPYNKMPAHVQQAYREKMAACVKSCLVRGNADEAEQIRDLVAKNSQNEELGKAIYNYGSAKAYLANNNYEEGLRILHTCVEEQAVDADLYWQEGVEQTRKAAGSNMDKIRQNEEIGKVKAVAIAYAALYKYDAVTESEFDEIYQELLAVAEKNRKEQNWERALNVYRSLQGVTETADEELPELISETNYEHAEAAWGRQNYSEASTLYKELGDYKDAAEKANESMYRKAEADINKGNFLLAAASFTSISGYKDADARALDAQYMYCEDTQEAPTSDTYECIDTLLENNYAGAEELRDEIYKWHAAIKTGINYSLGYMQSAYVKATLKGGPPDTTTKITFRIDDLTNGDHDTYSDGKEYKSGDTVTVDYSENESGYDLFDHTFRIRVYADGGELIGSWEGEIKRSF